jgi:hypothetical protein
MPLVKRVVGVPGEVIRRRAQAPAAPGADLEHGDLPDVLGQALVSVMDRVDALEKRLGCARHHRVFRSRRLRIGVEFARHRENERREVGIRHLVVRERGEGGRWVEMQEILEWRQLAVSESTN